MARRIRPRWSLLPFGAFGAVLPAIVAIAGKTDWFVFPINWQWIVAGIVYVASASLLAAIYPYGRRPTPFNATLVGVLFPTIVGSATSIAARAMPGGLIEATRGDGSFDAPEWAYWLDAFTLF